MGQLADDMIEGYSCSLCGVYFEEEHGHPVVCQSCWNDLSDDEKNDYQLATNDEL